MNKDEVVALMLKSINDDNRSICEQGGMPEDEINKQIEQSQPALHIILSNMYDKMKVAGVVS